MRRATLTFAEVAAAYGTSVKRVREAVRRGELATTQLAGKTFILRGPIEEQLGIKLNLSEDPSEDLAD